MPAHQPQQSHQQEIEPAATTQQSALQTHPTTTVPTVENEIGADPASPPPENSEEVPHARGPPVVGVEDMGLQDGKGVEMPLSNSESGSEDEPAAHDGQEQKPSDQADGKGETDNDGDILLGDVKNGGEGGQNAGGTAAGIAGSSTGTEQGSEGKEK